MRRRTKIKLVKVRCLGLKCPNGGKFWSDDKDGHRFCPPCDAERCRQSIRHVEPCKVTESDVRIYQG